MVLSHACNWKQQGCPASTIFSSINTLALLIPIVCLKESGYACQPVRQSQRLARVSDPINTCTICGPRSKFINHYPIPLHSANRRNEDPIAEKGIKKIKS